MLQKMLQNVEIFSGVRAGKLVGRNEEICMWRS